MDRQLEVLEGPLDVLIAAGKRRLEARTKKCIRMADVIADIFGAKAEEI